MERKIFELSPLTAAVVEYYFRFTETDRNNADELYKRGEEVVQVAAIQRVRVLQSEYKKEAVTLTGSELAALATIPAEMAKITRSVPAVELFD